MFWFLCGLNVRPYQLLFWPHMCLDRLEVSHHFTGVSNIRCEGQNQPVKDNNWMALKEFIRVYLCVVHVIVKQWNYQKFHHVTNFFTIYWRNVSFSKVGLKKKSELTKRDFIKLLNFINLIILDFINLGNKLQEPFILHIYHEIALFSYIIIISGIKSLVKCVCSDRKGSFTALGYSTV